MWPWLINYLINSIICLYLIRTKRVGNYQPCEKFQLMLLKESSLPPKNAIETFPPNSITLYRHRLQKAGIVPESEARWRHFGGTRRGSSYWGTLVKLSIKPGLCWLTQYWVLIKMSPLSPSSSGGKMAPSRVTKCKCPKSQYRGFLKFYAALRSKQRDWFSIASWLAGDSLQFRGDRRAEQEVCGKWNMFWQLSPEMS